MSKALNNSEEQTIRLTHTHSHSPEKFSSYEFEDSLKQEDEPGSKQEIVPKPDNEQETIETLIK